MTESDLKGMKYEFLDQTGWKGLIQLSHLIITEL